MKNLNAEEKEMETRLYKYKNLSSIISCLKVEIDTVEDLYDTVKGISYDGIKTSPTNETRNPIEEAFIKKEDKINDLKYQKHLFEIEKKKLEIAIHNFNSDQTILFNLLYINKDGLSRKQILSKMGISKNTYYKLQYQIIRSAINSINPKRTEIELYKRFLCENENKDTLKTIRDKKGTKSDTMRTN